MKEYNPQSQIVKKFEVLKSILCDGLALNLDLSDVIRKVENVIETINSEVISIALVGSFSDGKTSTIAGLLGRLEESMKIDTDESSDELKVYRPMGLKQGFEIIDTPGLFGTKEKEIDGKDVRFSEITERYLSQAHIILYLTGAVVPVKESHAEVLKHILRDLNKLDSTVFVINKMDEAGIDLLDEDDFNAGASIKRDTLKKRLQQTIGLSEDEARRLNVVCIAANPKGKGMEHWMSNMESYMQRSHIADLRETIEKVVASSNVVELKDSAVKASISEIMSTAALAIDVSSKSYSKALELSEDLTSQAKDDLESARQDLRYSRNELVKTLESLKSRVLKAISGASQSTISDVINEQLGTTDGDVSFYVLEGAIKMAMTNCCDANNVTLESVVVKMEKNFSHQNEFLNNALKGGVGSLKNVKITPEMVNRIRNMFFKNYKFKPWGMKNMATKATKVLNRVAVVLNVAIEAYEWWKQYQASKQLDELKANLVNAVESYFMDILSKVTDDEWYYAEMAPAYNELCEMLRGRENEIATIAGDIEMINNFNARLRNWAEVEDVEFEEI